MLTSPAAAAAARLYLDEVVTRANAFSDELDQERKELATILCLGAKDATNAQQEVSAKLYRALLREEVVSKRIDESSSPAQVGSGEGLCWGRVACVVGGLGCLLDSSGALV
jgi:hypothetical protein